MVKAHSEIMVKAYFEIMVKAHSKGDGYGSL